MPLPEPNQNEEKQDFVSRCVSWLSDNEGEKYPDNDQRVAICYSQWDRSKEDIRSKNPAHLLKEFYSVDVSASSFLGIDLKEEDSEAASDSTDTEQYNDMEGDTE